MSLLIKIIGSNKSSDEYKSAVKLKEILENSMPDETIGEIVLVANTTLYGQTVKDIDLLMVGTLRNYSPLLQFHTKDEDIESIVDIRSFCTVIEIKSHDILGISRDGTDVYVKYNGERHCVTEQSEKQKFSAMKFFQKTFGYSPFITNIIWFIGATKCEIENLLSFGKGNVIRSNILGNDFHIKEMMQLLIWQKTPHYSNGKFYFNALSSELSMDDFINELNLFTKAKDGMGQLTRKKIEQISRRSISNKDVFSSDTEISIYRGRAGTGKTIGLIQSALDLLEDDKGRILILTYNQALVSDIRRLFALADLPDVFNPNCVAIKTMHSFFYHVINAIFYDGKLETEKFLLNYNQYIKELNLFFKDGGISKEDYSEIINKDIYNLKWDYALIDEAQDWCNDERDLILSIFNKGHILIADGGQQFVRNNELCDWSIIKNRKNIKLKYCLRQKKNIISFLNKFSEYYLGKESNIKGSDEMVGGKVIITKGDRLTSTIHNDEITKLHSYGNSNYDMLYLVHPRLVDITDGQACFKYKKEFEKKGIYIWDGTNNIIRHNYSIDLNEVRLLQYESSRGLEGWTVVCLEFDEFIKIKEQQYIPEQNVSDLLLQSEKDKKKSYIYNWAMMPMTRAIDTLIITIKDEESDIAQLLRDIANKYPDYVLWI